MGTEYRVTLVHDQSVDLSALEAEILASMHRVDSSMSNYIEDSELSVFNASNAGVEQQVSNDFHAVLAESLELGEVSGGAFDITLGAAIDLWGFGSHGRITERPSDDTIRKMQDSVGYEKLTTLVVSSVLAESRLRVVFGVLVSKNLILLGVFNKWFCCKTKRLPLQVIIEIIT